MVSNSAMQSAAGAKKAPFICNRIPSSSIISPRGSSVRSSGTPSTSMLSLTVALSKLSSMADSISWGRSFSRKANSSPDASSSNISIMSVPKNPRISLIVAIRQPDSPMWSEVIAVRRLCSGVETMASMKAGAPPPRSTTSSQMAIDSDTFIGSIQTSQVSSSRPQMPKMPPSRSIPRARGAALLLIEIVSPSSRSSPWEMGVISRWLKSTCAIRFEIVIVASQPSYSPRFWVMGAIGRSMPSMCRARFSTKSRPSGVTSTSTPSRTVPPGGTPWLG